VKSNAHCPFIAVLALLGALLSVSSVLAADFSVDFGVETDAGKDAGSLTCQFDETCSAKIESLELRVSILVFRSEPDRVHVSLYGGDLRCCYFDGAADEKIIDPHQPLSRVSFFKGTRARGGLFIQNERMGTLYLRFDSR